MSIRLRLHASRWSAVAAALALTHAAGATAAVKPVPFWVAPAIAGYGKIHPLPKAAYQPDPRATYKVVFLLTRDGGKPKAVNPGLELVARTVNLYVSAGVPLDHLKFVAIITGPATTAVLDAGHFRSKFGVDNPNRVLIAELRKAGVDVAVCGQAVAAHHFPFSWVSHDVTLALSAVTTVTVLEHEGYGLVSM